MFGLGGSLLSKLKSLVLHKKEKAIPRILPDDLYLEILIRLPVKSTFRCKCVSKTWFSIISNPDFIKLHLSCTLKTNKYSRFMLSGSDSKIPQAVHMYNITKDKLFSTSKFYEKTLAREHHPYNSAELVGMIGSCNGLVCLQHRNKGTQFFSLWNPATKEYKRIPLPPYIHLQVYNQLAYFCYDYQNDDYKLVYGGYTPNFSVCVYTLRSNSWKSLQTKPYQFGDKDIVSVFVNGSLHWIAQNPKIIVSFNISDESFKEIQIPGYINHPYTSRLILKVLEGCHCAPTEAWVMHAYGSWEYWRKHQNKTSNRYYHMQWSSRSCCLIYHDDTDLDSCNVHPSARRFLGHRTFNVINLDNNYVEALVSLNTGAYLGRPKAIRRGIWRKMSIPCCIRCGDAASQSK